MPPSLVARAEAAARGLSESVVLRYLANFRYFLMRPDRDGLDAFGARLDPASREIIERGRRIRACLMQPELSPVPVPTQIATLLALTAGLFESIPLAHMSEAERVVHRAATTLPVELRARFETSKKLSAEDRSAVLAHVEQALGKRWSATTTPDADAGAGGAAEGASKSASDATP